MILIVEDTESLRKLTRKILEKEGFSVDEAENGEIEGLTTPKLNFNQVAQEILKNLGTDSSIDDIYIVIKNDNIVGEDKILFSQYFKK